MAQTMARTRAPKPTRKPPRVKAPWPLNILQSAIGLKWVMALTGLGLMGFVFAHMLGNLKLYQGPTKTKEYAETLRAIGTDIIPETWFLWLLRFGLLAMAFFHVFTAIKLQEMGRKANGGSSALVGGNKRYMGGRDYATDPASNFAARTMRMTGPIILLFVIFHLIDITWAWFGWFDGFERGEPYRNVVESMQFLPVALIYIIANIALAVHIYHGGWSLFQSLGISNDRFNKARRAFAAGFAGLILVGNLSFPIMVQAGIIDDDGVPVGDLHSESEIEEEATQ